MPSSLDHPAVVHWLTLETQRQRISPSALAEKSGVPFKMIVGILRSELAPTVSTVSRLARPLGFDVVLRPRPLEDDLDAFITKELSDPAFYAAYSEASVMGLKRAMAHAFHNSTATTWHERCSACQKKTRGTSCTCDPLEGCLTCQEAVDSLWPVVERRVRRDKNVFEAVRNLLAASADKLRAQPDDQDPYLLHLADAVQTATGWFPPDPPTN